MLVHFAEATAWHEIHFFTQVFSSKIAVDCFFIISGYLVYASYNTSKERYFLRRVLRILPAYLVLIVFQALLVIFLSPSAMPILTWIKYFLAHLAFLNFLYPTFGNLFDSLPLPFLNPSLWSLKVEVFFYILVPLVFKWIKYHKTLPIFIVYILSAFWVNIGLNSSFILSDETLSKVWNHMPPAHMMYFMVGVAAFHFKDFWLYKTKLFLLPTLALTLLCHYLNWYFLTPLFLGAFIMAVCNVPLPPLQKLKFRKQVDISYGIYLYHFPIIQTFLIVFGVNAYGYVILALPFTCLIALLSWKAVEFPILNFFKKQQPTQHIHGV